MMNTEKQGLTKREKTLLMMLACIGLLYVAFQFVFMPAYNQYNDKTEELQNLQNKEMEVRTTLATEENTKASHEKALGDYSDLKGMYPAILTTEAVGRLLNGLCVDNGLEYLNQKLSDPVVLTIPKKDADGKVTSEEKTAFSVVTATMTVNGNYTTLKSLLEAIEKLDYIRISRLSFNKGQFDEVWEKISITFEVTMLNEVR